MQSTTRTGIGIVALAALGTGAFFAMARQPAPDLPAYWQSPAFALVDQQGDTLRHSDLAGTAWVASFIFTNCADVCPMITRTMAELRDSLAADEALGGPVRLVSFSVDPARDSPEVLREYAARYGGSPPGDWAFLTGSPPDAVRELVQDGFRLSAVAPPEAAAVGGSTAGVGLGADASATAHDDHDAHDPSAAGQGDAERDAPGQRATRQDIGGQDTTGRDFTGQEAARQEAAGQEAAGAPAADPGANYQIIHASRLLLIDAEGAVRGVYRSEEPDVIETVLRDLRALR